ncbi:MAG: hypothetical protein JJE17_11945 [Peptostreptococcaceae bacterium]|nr:hypothetical protein [Peptostreptococcaceae bacterium]
MGIFVFDQGVGLCIHCRNIGRIETEISRFTSVGLHPGAIEGVPFVVVEGEQEIGDSLGRHMLDLGVAPLNPITTPGKCPFCA